MNYRAVFSDDTIRIETTHAAADPGTNVYGSLKIARAHLEMWIDRRVDELRDAKRYWRSVPERKLPSDEPKIEQASAQEEPADDDLEIPENLRRVSRPGSDHREYRKEINHAS